MQRINTLVQKISELAENGDKNTVIDVDLMLDYTRVIYADLLEYRGRLLLTSNLPETEPAEPQAPAPEHTTPIDRSTAVYQSPEEDAVVQTVEIDQEEEENDIRTSEPVKAPAAHYIQPENNIRHRIGINDKYQFISELFGNNRDEYEQTLDALSTFDDHHDAVQWLHHNVFDQRNWSDENESVQMFYEVLSNFFDDK